MRRLLLVAVPLALLLGGCIDVLDSSWFNPRDPSTGDYLAELDLYDWREIPDANIELVELTSTKVDGEDEAPTIYGMWAHQCLEGQCVTVDRPEFSAVNQDKTILYLHGNDSHIPGHCDRLQMPIKYVNRLVQMRALRAHHNRHSIENGFRPERDVTVRAGENHAAGVCGERQRATRVVEIDAVMWPQCATLR